RPDRAAVGPGDRQAAAGVRRAQPRGPQRAVLAGRPVPGVGLPRQDDQTLAAAEVNHGSTNRTNKDKQSRASADDALVFEFAVVAEGDQQAQPQTGGFEVVVALGAVFGG